MSGDEANPPPERPTMAEIPDALLDLLRDEGASKRLAWIQENAVATLLHLILEPRATNRDRLLQRLKLWWDGYEPAAVGRPDKYISTDKLREYVDSLKMAFSIDRAGESPLTNVEAIKVLLVANQGHSIESVRRSNGELRKAQRTLVNKLTPSYKRKPAK